MHTAAALCVALLFAACASTPRALRGSDDKPIRDAAPAPYRIAVAPVEVDASVRVGAADEGDKWYLSTGSSGELRAMFVESLRELGASTEIAMLEESPDAADLDQVYDLVLVPRLTRADFEYSGASDRIWASTGAWLFTWIGALWVSDAAYDGAGFALECQIYDPHSQEQMVNPVVFDPGELRLKFWERNDAWTTGFFMTLVFPPFWARDKADVVSDSLTRNAMRHLAGRVKRYLLEDHDARVSEDRFAQVTFSAPGNGSQVGESMDLACNVKTRQPVLSALVFKNGEPLQAEGGVSVSELPDPSAQMREIGYEFDMSASGIPMDPGANTIRLLLILEGGRRTSRSIVVNNG